MSTSSDLVCDGSWLVCDTEAVIAVGEAASEEGAATVTVTSSSSAVPSFTGQNKSISLGLSEFSASINVISEGEDKRLCVFLQRFSIQTSIHSVFALFRAWVCQWRHNKCLPGWSVRLTAQQIVGFFSGSALPQTM